MNSIGVVLTWLGGCALGLFLADMHPSGIEPLYTGLLIGLSLCVLLPMCLAWSDKRGRWASIFLLAVLAGCGRALLVHPPISPGDLAFYNGDAHSPVVQVRGEVAAEPVVGDTYQRLRIHGTAISLPGRQRLLAVSGDMLTLLPRYPAYYVGDHLQLTGKLTVPPSSGSFDYAGYLARHGVLSYMLFPHVARVGAQDANRLLGWVSPIRARVRSAIEASMPEPQAALAVGVVTEDRTSIPQPVLDAFRTSGTTHILAISGQNMTLLVGAVYLFFGMGSTRRRMPGWMLGVVLLLLAFYTVFTGATPSVIRAAVMSAVLLMSQAFGRRFDPISALAVSAAAMAMWEPNVLADGGFLLSFAAMVGLAQVSPFVLRALSKLKVPLLLSAPLSAGIGAQVVTVPLIMLYTGRISLVSPLATLTTEFALLPLMIAGIVLGIGGPLFAPLGTLLGIIAWPWATWMLTSVQMWASLPAASIETGTVGAGMLVPYYLLVALLVWWAREGKRRFQVGLLPMTLAGVAIVGWCFLVALALPG